MTPLTVKSQRLLEQLGVAKAFQQGGKRVLTGPVYELRKDPGIQVRLLFEKEDEALNLGYAAWDGAQWEVVESEPFSFRALGYYERRLKRLGDFVENRPVEVLRKGS